MPFTPPVIARARDLQPLYVAIRATLVGNVTIANTLAATDSASNTAYTKIFRDFDNTRNAFPFIAMSIASATPDMTYGTTGYNAHMDVQVFTDADSTAADSLAYLAQQTLLDANWTITNYQIVHKEAVNIFSGSQEFNGKQLYRVGFTLEIRAYRTS